MVRTSTWEKHMPLLPHNKMRDNPLFIVLAILAFLATLSLLSLRTSHHITSTWNRDLAHTATVQIKPDTLENGTPHARKAKDILRASPNIANVNILPLAYSQDLLRPWLGNVTLPEGLPLPILLHIQIHPNKTLNITGLENAFAQAGIRADIDTHHRWNKELKAKTRALQMLTFTALVLILIAIIAACIFAVQAKVMENRKLMHVLTQIGAPPLFIRKLLSTHFALASFKASSIGAFIACLILFLLTFFIGQQASNNAISNFSIGLPTLFLAASVPVFIAIISGLSTWYTVISTEATEAIYDEQ